MTFNFNELQQFNNKRVNIVKNVKSKPEEYFVLEIRENSKCLYVKKEDKTYRTLIEVEKIVSITLLP